MLEASGTDVRFMHMIYEVVRFIREELPELRAVGVLCTQGTYASGVYRTALGNAGITPPFPDEEGREEVQNAISHAAYGIKAFSHPITPRACHALDVQARATHQTWSAGFDPGMHRNTSGIYGTAFPKYTAHRCYGYSGQGPYTDVCPWQASLSIPLKSLEKKGRPPS